ncbi:hypothetical protein [Tenacibaculum agarivorans]|uniref:hypothetical protein n=1 Tax=Tenacibaculum agarivorans TaxID=1908389 RepID=UPI00094BC242|nr:hypothetical protein [Tenacibaculum agarivorans]
MNTEIKKVFLSILILTGLTVTSQNLPTEPRSGYAFQLGSKFTIKLYPTDSINFNYSIVKFEPYQEIIDTWDNDNVFEKEGEKNTIDFFFGLGTSGETEKEKEKNMKVLLLMKNRTPYSLNYKSDIQREENGKFEKTSNVGTHSGLKGIEIWPYMIYQIGLKEFKKMK